MSQLLSTNYSGNPLHKHSLNPKHRPRPWVGVSSLFRVPCWTEGRSGSQDRPRDQATPRIPRARGRSGFAAERAPPPIPPARRKRRLLAACGQSHAAQFSRWGLDGRCIPPEPPPTGRTGTSFRSSLRFGRNTPGIPPSRALSAGRLAPSSPGGGPALTPLYPQAARGAVPGWPVRVSPVAGSSRSGARCCHRERQGIASGRCSHFRVRRGPPQSDGGCRR